MRERSEERPPFWRTKSSSSALGLVFCQADEYSKCVVHRKGNMRKILVCLLAIAGAHIASAAVCDYAPSKLVGAPVAGSVATGAGAAAAVGNGVTGAAMLGSTAAGASAAGTAGILAGTAGTIGSVGAVLLSPFVIIPAAITAGAIVTYEGGCYLAEKDKK